MPVHSFLLRCHPDQLIFGQQTMPEVYLEQGCRIEA